MKIMRYKLKAFSLAVCMSIVNFLVVNEVSAQSLTYQEGGAPSNIADPAQDAPVASRRYVCSNGGSDSNDGLTSSTPWATIGKINSAWGSIPSNAIITLCRGGSWSSSSITNKAGTVDAPTAIGAYGSCTASAFFDNMCSNAPRINGTLTLNGSSWITVRDLSVRRLDTSFGSHDILVYRNQAKGPGGGTASNIYKAFAESYHMVYIENIATDADSNDYFSAHVDGSGTANKDGWWYIDNICIGSGGEDCIDLMNSEPIQGSQHITEDSKVIATRMVGRSLSGYSNLTGRAQNCVNTGHAGKYYWWVGNVCLGWQADWIWNFSRQTDKSDAQISGNFVIADDGNGNVMRNYSANQNTYHNTFVNGGSSGSVASFDSNGQRFDYNIVIHTNSGNSSALVDTRTANNQIASMNNNWYGTASGETVTDGQTLSQRKANTSFDQNSSEGGINGFTMPTVGTYPNPNDWRNASFLNDITPSSAWAGCNGANTPGARDCSGNYLGWKLEPISGASNGGCGWAGLPIVGVKLAQLGITGQCAPNSSGSISPRPEPPILISAQ